MMVKDCVEDRDEEPASPLVAGGVDEVVVGPGTVAMVLVVVDLEGESTEEDVDNAFLPWSRCSSCS